MYRDKPNLVRVGSLIQYLEDGDIGIILELVDEKPKANGHQEVMIWWCYENARKGIGIESFSFEPFGETETVLRY